MANFIDDQLQQHVSKQFDKELQDVHTRILRMGGLVQEQVALAARALTEGDTELAEQVVNDDYKINTMEVSIDEECTQILVRRQPTARDLRLVVAAIKVISELERIGDEAKRVARLTIDMAAHFPKRNQFTDIGHLAERAAEMLRDSLDAFARLDVDQAFRVVQEDSEVNREYEGVLRHQLTYMMEDARSIPVSLNIMWAARALERIGDRSCNICEYIIYCVKGKDVRHVKLADVEKTLQG